MNAAWSGVLALAGGCALAILLLVPWATVQYRRRGEIGFGPAVIAFATLVYSLALVTYTLLPLPRDVATLCADGGAGRVWRPLTFVRDVADHGGWSLHNPAALQVVFNVLLFVPLGMIVRHALFRRRGPVLGVLAATGIGLAVSVLIETTQLTGDWFLYPCAYRVFDVDDMLTNTGGAFLGALAAPLLGAVVGRAELPPRAPRPVTAARRMLGMACDVIAVALTASALGVAINASAALSGHDIGSAAVKRAVFLGTLAPAALALIMVLAAGRTLGEAVVRLRNDPRPGPLRGVLRWAVGIGGWWVLLAVGLSWAALGLALVSLVAVWVTPSRRGLAAWIVRVRVVDDRVERADTAGADTAVGV